MGFAFSPVRPRACSAKRTLFSLWLTARTTNCPSTLKKGASQSKSLLNDRVRSLFGRSLEPLLSSGRQLPPFLLLPAPRRFLPLSRQPFSPLAPLVFSTARFRRVFSVFLYAGVIGGLCRRAALPVRTLPPAGSARHSALLFHPCALRPSAWSLSRPSARMSTPPNGFVFRTTTPRDQFRPRAGFPIKQITALAALCLQPRRDQPLSPPPLRPAYRQGTAAHKNHLSSSSCVRIGCRRPALVFMPGGRAPAVLPFLLPPARFLLVFRGCASVCCGASAAPACRGLRHRRRARTKVGDRS